MRGCARVFGWISVSLAVLWAVLAVLMLAFPDIDEETGEETDAALGGIFLTILFGVPGGIVLWRTGVANRDEKFETQLVGYVYSHDRFTVADLARKIGRNEMETEALIQELNVKRNIGLAYHRPTREYIHFARVQQNARVATHCSSCGASLGQQMVFEGEQLTCPYCNAAVQTQPASAMAPASVPGQPGGRPDVPQPVQPGYPPQQQGYPPQQQGYPPQQQGYPPQQQGYPPQQQGYPPQQQGYPPQQQGYPPQQQGHPHPPGQNPGGWNPPR